MALANVFREDPRVEESCHGSLLLLEVSKRGSPGKREKLSGPLPRGEVRALLSRLPCTLSGLSDTPQFVGPTLRSSVRQCTCAQTPHSASARTVMWAAAATHKFLSTGSEKE